MIITFLCQKKRYIHGTTRYFFIIVMIWMLQTLPGNAENGDSILTISCIAKAEAFLGTTSAETGSPKSPYSKRPIQINISKPTDYPFMCQGDAGDWKFLSWYCGAKYQANIYGIPYLEDKFGFKFRGDLLTQFYTPNPTTYLYLQSEKHSADFILSFNEIGMIHVLVGSCTYDPKIPMFP